MRNKELYKSMLYAVQSVSEAVKEHSFNQELIDSLALTAQPITEFFSLSLPEAVLLCYFIDASLKDQIVNKETIISHFGKDITALADLDDYIESLSKRKLILLSNRNRKFSRQFKVINLNPKVLAAMAEADPILLGNRPCSTFSEFLLDVNDLIIQRINSHISDNELYLEVKDLINLNKSIREIRWLKKQKMLKGFDLLIFLNICVEQSEGEEPIDIDKMINEVIENHVDRMKYKQSIKNGSCVLFKNNYIVHAGNIFGIMNMVELSDESIDHLMAYMRNEKKKEFLPRMGQLITYEKITKENLYYNQKEQSQVNTLRNALQHENYNALIDRMKLNNMVPGFTVLLYGMPGTGKTATVKSIAQETGRHIFMIDIPKINSKWVGESEKNLSRLFDEYRRAKKVFAHHPILLFNEADAILGKRIDGSNSVDKMNNSLQNILLQELEDFEGIFMATTNLADHLDSAFDRRLLYKIEFKKPEFQVRQEIIRNSFPDLDSSVLDDINHNFQLTGGQITNIRKKLLVKGLLGESFKTEEELMALCEEENALRNFARPVIGFHKN